MIIVTAENCNLEFETREDFIDFCLTVVQVYGKKILPLPVPENQDMADIMADVNALFISDN